ncbi:MAG: hypothetical protein U0796_01905 [Gemmatales bacterium]
MIKQASECKICRKPIPPETVERRRGRCLRCYRQQEIIPPPGSGKLRQLYDRLVAVDMDPIPILENRWMHKDPDFLRQLEREEETKRIFLKWIPQLRAYAEDCRRRMPLLDQSQLTTEQLAKQQVMQTVMTQQYARQYRANIVTMPLLAISLAYHLWPVVDSNVVYLTHEELEAWRNSNRAFDKKYWYAFHELRWQEPPFEGPFLGRVDMEIIQRKNKLHSHEMLWLVSVSEVIGPLCGGGHSNLWVWDGKQPRLLKERIAMWVS